MTRLRQICIKHKQEKEAKGEEEEEIPTNEF